MNHKINKHCIIKERALLLISKKIYPVIVNSGLVKFFGECGIKENFYEFMTSLNFLTMSPTEAFVSASIKIKLTDDLGVFTSSEELFSQILIYYSCSKHKDRKILFKIIESSIDPLLFNANKKEAENFKDGLNEILELNGYRLEHGKIEKFENGQKEVDISVFEEKGKGYIKIDERRIFIGNTETSKFQLLNFLVHPKTGLAKTIEESFKKIEKFTRRKTSDVNDSYMANGYKIQKIEGTIKELQRIFKKYKINKNFKFKIENGKVWLQYKS